MSVVGPFEFVQVTYNTWVRVEDDREIATFVDGLWLFDDGWLATDLTVSTIPSDED